ncbi:MAG: hypothetical protein R3A48_04260 [Polyangiales bacterium]
MVVARGLFATRCAPESAAVALLLVTLPGVLLAGLCGLLGALTARRGLATTLAAALVPAFVLWSVARFYATPTIFAYDPFFGFFPGAIYGEDVPLGTPLLSYRLGTLGWILAGASALASGWDGARLRLRRRLAAPLARTACALGALLGAGIYLAGPSLGHRHDARDLDAALAGRRGAAAAWCATTLDPPAAGAAHRE